MSASFCDENVVNVYEFSVNECSACRDRPLTHRFVAVPGVGHSHCSIFQSKEMLAAMFPDATVATMQAARGRGNGTETSSDDFAHWYP